MVLLQSMCQRDECTERLLNTQFLIRGLQSKRIARLEHQLSVNIKATHNKIWTGVTKDLSFLRRILNEVNLMNLQVISSALQSL